MRSQAQDRERALSLLRAIIERSPSDARNRSRLLCLLYAGGNKDDFAIEAQSYKDNCDLTFDADWPHICTMGREIDPDNEMFHTSGDLPVVDFESESTRPVFDSSTDNAGGNSANLEEIDKRGTDTDSATESNDDSDQRCLADRRVADRRTRFTAWYGTERRKQPRRQKVRRDSDVAARRKRR